MSEFELIERLLARTRQKRGDVVIGPGDDAAVLAVPKGHQLVAATDTLVEDVHFRLGTAPADLGWKVLAVNLSDLAAMGASPAWAMLSLTLPASDAAFVDALGDGFAALASRYKLALIGGDTTRGPLALGVCVLGLLPDGTALTRSGAKPGDLIYVTGTLGDAAGGLRCLDRNDSDADELMAAPADTREHLVARLNRPEPRIAVGHALRGVASSCIDVSDGLLADLAHICRGSGAGARIDAGSVPRSDALQRLFNPQQALAMALAGGDDYELCFTVAADRANALSGDLARLGCAATRIGRIIEGEGVQVFDDDGSEIHPRQRGWNHFST